jgi:arylformamidase
MISRRALLGLAAALALPLRALAAPAAREIAYGDDPLQRLDVYPIPGLRRAPVVVFVHGGGWRRGDKRMVNSLPAFAERHGFLLASVNYRLTPAVDAGGCAEDVAAAVARIRREAAGLGGDPARIFLVGHSAGAHLVALVATDPVYLAKHGLKPGDLAGVVPVDGAGYDAVRQMAALEGRPGMLADMYQRAFGSRAAALSPTLRVAPGRVYPPFLILHVARRPDARTQSEGLARALIAAGGRAEVVAAPGRTHMTINRELGVAGDPQGERAAAFIRTGRLSGS